MVAVIGFLDSARGLEIEAQQILHKGGHARIDLDEQVAVGRIQRVVEIEYPRPDMPEIRTRPWCAFGVDFDRSHAAKMVDGPGLGKHPFILR